LTRRSFLLGGLAAVAAGGCRGPAANVNPHVVSVWHPWGGTMAPAFRRVCAAFERAHPGFTVRAVFTPNDLSNNQKFFTSVAAGCPPDAIFVDGPQVAEWAERGALEPLDHLVRAAGIGPTDYFTPCWKQCEYAGHVWALTFCADPNFGFVWNKADFEDAGLDPERPPVTIAEMDAMADRLAKWDDGKLKRIGLIPWAEYGSTNSLFTWGWAFGGSFYDERARKVTPDHPGVVKALEWMCSYARKYDITKIAALQAGFGTAEQNPFYVGKLAMTCLHISGIDEIRRYAPKLRYGITYIPYPPGGEPHSSWVGGWCMGIPKGSRNREGAEELLRWMCATNEGTVAVGQASGLFPGYRRSPCFAEVRNRPGVGMLYKILLETRHQRPVMPAQAYYMGALQRAVEAALYGQKTPIQALRDAGTETQAELDFILAGQGRRG